MAEIEFADFEFAFSPEGANSERVIGDARRFGDQATFEVVFGAARLGVFAFEATEVGKFVAEGDVETFVVANVAVIFKFSVELSGENFLVREG